MKKVEKYSWFKDGSTFTVIHTEGKVTTLIALCDTSEKADIISKALNQFSLERFETEMINQKESLNS